MLQQALFMVRITSGPEYCEKFIKQRYGFRLVLDDNRKKLLAVFGINNEEIIIDINLVDIVSIVCLDAAKIKEQRHRIQVITKSYEVYDFYVDVPYQCDPLPFIGRVQHQINYAKNPATEVRDNKAATIFSLIVCTGFFIWTIVDWTNGGTIGWGIISLFISIASGMAAYHGFGEWKNW